MRPATFHLEVNAEQLLQGNDPIAVEVCDAFALEMVKGLRCFTCFQRDDVGGGECSNCIEAYDRYLQDREDYWREEAE
jgi:hypothetical protein